MYGLYSRAAYDGARTVFIIVLWYIRDIVTTKIFVVYFFNEIFVLIFLMILWNIFNFLMYIQLKTEIPSE